MAYKSKLRWIGLQFFADDPTPPDEPSPTPTPSEEEQPQGEKTFTQAEVSRMMANEKRQGRTAIMRELGLDVEDKDAVKNAKALLDSLKTREEKDAEALKTAQDALSGANEKAMLAERKLSVYISGCNKEYVDEVMALASAKVTDEVDFETALQQVKEKCSAFFTVPDEGTGRPVNPKRGPAKKEPGNYGKMLAERAKPKHIENNPYFNN